MSSTNGLRRISATSIDNSGPIRLGDNINPGILGQVIKSQGDYNPAVWADESTHTNNPLTMGSNVSLVSGNISYDGSISETIQSVNTDTIYQEGAGIKINNSALPNPEISTRTDNFTINAIASGTNPKNLNVLRVPKELKPGLNITYSPPSATGFNGSADVIINATNTEYTGGDGIEITATDIINAKTDSNTTSINATNEIEVLRVPNQLRSGANIQMTTSAGLIQTNYDGDQEIIINSVPIEYTAGDGIIVNAADEEISASLDSITLDFNGSAQIEVLKVPNELQQGANIVMTNSLGVNVAEFDGSEVVSIKLEESPIIQDLTITGGSNRWIRTKDIQTLIIQGGTIEAYFIQGNSSNGGENADTNENLVFEVLDAGFFVIGSPVVVSSGATGYIGNLFTLFSYTLTLPQRSQGYYLQFRQTTHSGFAFDNYGIKYIRFNSGESDVRILNLPTFAPSETGRLWNNSGVLNIVP